MVSEKWTKMWTTCFNEVSFYVNRDCFFCSCSIVNTKRAHTTDDSTKFYILPFCSALTKRNSIYQSFGQSEHIKCPAFFPFQLAHDFLPHLIVHFSFLSLKIEIKLCPRACASTREATERNMKIISHVRASHVDGRRTLIPRKLDFQRSLPSSAHSINSFNLIKSGFAIRWRFEYMCHCHHGATNKCGCCSSMLL